MYVQAATLVNLQECKKLQNKAMRSILQCDRYANISTVLKILKWISVAQGLKYQTFIFIKKITKWSNQHKCRDHYFTRIYNF